VLLAIGLGFDTPTPGLMQRVPRPADAPIISRSLGVWVVAAGLLMAGLTLGVVAWGEHRYELTVATTMGLVSLSLLHIVASIEVRDMTLTVFSSYTLSNRRFVLLIVATLALTFVVTSISALQRIFDTVALTSSQWGVCLLGPIVYLALAELGKLVLRRTGRGGSATLAPAPA